MFVLHTCDNRACCNPRHLYIGTQKDNMQDRERRNRMEHPHHGKGYFWHHGVYEVWVSIGGKRVYIGRRKTKEEAAQLYQDAIEDL
jgi:hypothetical protein